MHFTEKSKTILYAFVVGILITPGLVILAWRFQIFSYFRLARTSLYVFLLPVIAALIFNRFFPIKFTIPDRKKILLDIGISLASSVIVTGYRSDIVRYLVTLILSSILFFFIGLAFVKLSEVWKRNATQLSFTIFFLVIGIIGVSIYLYMSFFVRPYADDFCFTNLVRTDGFFATINNFYHDWSGRIFSDLFMFGFSSTKIMPFLEILLLVLGLYFVLHRVREDSHVKFSLWAALDAIFLPFAIFSVIPAPYKSLYWITNTELIFPVSITLILFIGFMLRGFLKGFKHVWLSMCAAFFMGVAIASGHEILVPTMFLVILMFLLLALLYRKKYGPSAIMITLGALVGVIVGSLIVVLAPGNYARMAQQGYPRIPDLLTAVRLSIGYYADFFVDLSQKWGSALLMASFLGGMYTKTLLQKSWKSLIVIFIITLGSSWSTFLVSAFAMSQTLPTRTQIIPMLILVIGVFSLGVVFPIPKNYSRLTITTAAFLLPLGFVFTQVLTNETKLIAPIVQYAKEWDFRDYQVRVMKIEPYAIHIPWESSEAKLDCMNFYYNKP